MTIETESTFVRDEIDWRQLTEQARAFEGQPVQGDPHLTIAGRASIGMWAKGIGSRNRIYIDEGYARKAVYGGIIAPGVFLHAMSNSANVPGLHRLGTLLCSISWRFERPVRVEERVIASTTACGSELKHTRFAGKALLQGVETRYTAMNGSLYGVANAQCLRYDRSAAVASKYYAHYHRHKYTLAQLEDIDKAYVAEKIRGDDSLYLDDVEVGQSIGRLVRGPLNADDVIMFTERTAPKLTYERFLRARLENPDIAYFDEYNVPQSYDGSMLLDEVAQRIGLPVAHDSGIQRVAWLEDLIRNWAGDWSQIRELSVRLIRPNFATFTTWCSGKVTSVNSPEASDPDVTLQLECTNQLGEVTAEGSALVRLPSRVLTHSLLVR